MPAKARGGKPKNVESPKRSTSQSRTAANSKSSEMNEGSGSQSPKPKAEKTRSRTPTRQTERKPASVSRSRSRSRSASRTQPETPRTQVAAQKNTTNVAASSVRNRAVNEVRPRPEVPSKAARRPTGLKALINTLRLDFGGPLGSLMMMCTLPPFVLALNSLCTFKNPGVSSKGNCGLGELQLDIARLQSALQDVVRDLHALAFLLGWLTLQAALYVLPVGSVVDGYDPRERLRYRVNLSYALVITVALIVFAVAYLKFDVFGFLILHLSGIAWWSIVFAFVGALGLYAMGRRERDRTNPHGNTGWFIHDYFMGRVRNPRLRKWKWLALFDFKMFCELRPGLLLWALVDVSYLVVHYREVRAIDTTTVWYGVPNGFSWNLALLVLFHLSYVVDGALSEQNILSTFDILTEGFGWMLLFGDLGFVPFVYSASARYLLASLGTLCTLSQSPFYLAAVTAMHAVGYYVFRGANNVKHDFRTTPNAPSLAHLRTLTVASGRKILVSGWWGLSRHPNYLGDLLMAWSWSLLCGFPQTLGAFAIAYFYPIFLTGLLLSRAVRDDVVRREKYGETAWKRYCELVKWRVVPYIF